MDYNTRRRGHTRGRGRGKTRGFYKGHRGGRRKNFQHMSSSNYDTISCQTQNVEENRLIDTKPITRKGWKKQSEGINQTHKRIDEDTMSIQSDTANSRNFEKSEYYNEWDSPDDYLTNSLKQKQKNKKRRNQGRMYNKYKNNKKYENTHKTEMSTNSMASDITK